MCMDEIFKIKKKKKKKKNQQQENFDAKHQIRR